MDTKKKIRINKFDDLFPYIGGLGVYQISHLFILCIPAFLNPDSIMINFIGYEMEHWCQVPQLENLTFAIQKNVAIPFDGEEYSQCEYLLYDYNNYTMEDFITWNRSQMEPEAMGRGRCQNWVFDRSVFTETVLSRWNVVCDDFWLIGLLSTIFIAGHTFGSLTVGEVADRVGRKYSILLFAILRVSGAYLQVFAPSYEWLAVARFLVGAGVMGCYLTAFVLNVELVDPKHRVWFSSVITMWYIAAYVTIPGMAYAIRDYQKLLMPLAGVALLLFSYYWLLPESARWLVAKGRRKDAEKVLRQMAAANGMEFPENLDLDPLFERQESSAPKQRGIVDLLGTSPMRNWMLIIYFYWFSTSLIYFALSLNAGSLVGDIFLNTFLLGAVEIPAGLINIYVLQTGLVGRKTMSCISMSLAGVASFISIPLILQDSEIAGTLSVVTALLGKAGAAMAFTDIYIYTSEVVPTEVRNIGMGTSSVCARLSGMAAPYVGGILADVWEPMPFLIYGIFGVVSGVLMLFMPETRGKLLSQTIEETVQTLGKSGSRQKQKEELNGVNTEPMGQFNNVFTMEENTKL